MKFEIKGRWTGSVIFEAEIEATEHTSLGVRIGLAVKAAIKADADLNGANLRGADLSGANLRGADLSDADLSGANLRGAELRGAYLRDAYLSGADLSGANLRRANLRGADLSDAELRGADLSDAETIPVIKDIHKRVYESASDEGALDMGSWHQNGFCGTTHCRAGWVTHLAGREGKALDEKYGTSGAAALIYFASDPSMSKVPNFYASNEDALADMKAMAEASK